ncbi:hypothetical protein H310_07371 [Aphanomyces invadans]|uniref:Uncharacterized protein n=1 Tax=Aphanomyces invadans TaxID=157072 RepID=A0A024U3P9_9STRA|nr:hypothetical protein H310_07371 [Aphanomyces invadans]ETW00845.1 hypothetical protein H310_07371 [Aphanomyces invadans]|eukprot:XP_008870980.1 hypothetical protein H310_07371 [Aphanomyces invadans]
MSTALRRCAVHLRRTKTPARRFNSGTPQGPAEAAPGHHGPTPPPPHGELKWANRLNDMERKFKSFSSGEFHGQHRYKGPLWGFLGGAFVGYVARPGKESTLDVEELRRLRHVARDLQDESRELKSRLALMQQTIDQIRIVQHQHAIPPRPCA